jgi:hypothetical protein
MANHVSNYISVYGNDAALEAFMTICNRVSDTDPDAAESYHIGDASYMRKDRLDMPDPNEYNYNYEYYLNEVGAKWAFLEEYDEGYANLTSAWGGLIPLAKYISEEIAEADPNSYITLTCEDEMPNWFSVHAFHKGEQYDYAEWDWDDLVNSILDNYSDDIAPKTQDIDDWTDEEREFLSDVQYEVMQELQDRELDSIRQALEYDIEQIANAHTVGC